MQELPRRPFLSAKLFKSNLENHRKNAKIRKEQTPWSAFRHSRFVENT
jgi:hypothetical protein